MLRRRSKDPAQKRRRRLRKLRLLAVLTVLLALGLGSFVFGFARAVAGEIPRLDPAYQERLERNGYIYATTEGGRRTLAVLRGSQSRVLLRSQQIADVMKLAIVAVEDRRFFEHDGVDLRGVARALWEDVRHRGVVQGGSTITQQFIKNVYVKNQPTLARKLKEAALAWQLEGNEDWSKERILTAYLNTIYFGNGAYGVQQAAMTYFRHGARDLTLPEAALLAGIPKDPTRFDPVTNPEEARGRRAVVLRAMREEGMISRLEHRKALRAPLPEPDDVRLPGTEGPAQYFVNYVKQQLIDRYGAARVFGGGLRVRTSLDLELQRIARKSISKWLTSPTGPSAALVAIDPKNGKILAMVGGNNYRKSQFNLAVQSQRQPGSAFKPFVLATALEEGIAPSTTFVSRPVSIPLGDRVWSVSNYEDSYLGTIDLEAATTHSDNAVYAQLTQLVGPASVVRTARRLGIRSRLRNYFSIGLGAQAVNPLELARGFSAFANGGFRVDGSLSKIRNRPRAIVSVTDEKGRVENRVVPRRVLKSETAGLVTSLLQDVVEQGTGTRAALPDRPAAGKTGTTENYGDAWFVGYTPRLVTAVWVGYPNDLRPMLTEFHGEPVAGGTYPARIWRTFMQKALFYLRAEPEPFPPRPALYETPANVVLRDGRLRLDNGYCRGTRQVAFFSGVAPRTTADCKPNEVEVPRVVGRTLADARALLSAQPLTPKVVFKPAAPRERPGIVLRQRPAGGTASSFDEVTLVLARPLDGVVPKVVGLDLPSAQARLLRMRLQPRVVRFQDGRAGRVLFQAPLGGVAAARGMVVRLVVGRD